MSNLLKSKFLLGVLAVVIGLSLAGSALAADGAITLTLKKGMKNVQVKYLQQTLNEKGFPVASTGAGSVGNETTYFGPATVKAVKAFQAAQGLVADGIFGAKSRAALGGSVVVNTNCPAGALFNPTTGAPCTTTTTPVTTGPVSVMLSTDNPASGTIIAGQALADLAHFTFTGSGTLNSITLKRSGISDQSTLTNVYLYDGITRLTDGYSFNNTGELTMSGINLTVSGTKVLSVKADLAATSTSIAQFSVAVSLTGYTANGSAVTANLSGNTMQIATGATTGTATLSGANTIAVSSSPTVNPGTTAYPLWSAPMNISTRSLFMKSASFRVIGSAPVDALANMKLYKDGLQIGSTSAITTANGTNYISFDLTATPAELTTGSHTIEVRADVIKGSSLTVQLSLQQASDMVLYDQQIGVNVAISSFAANSKSTIYAITIGQGSLSVVIDPTFNTLLNVTGGATNTTIAKFKLHAYGEDVKINSLSILPVATSMLPGGDALGLQNVTTYFNGSQIGSQDASWLQGDGAEAYTPGSQMIVPAGVDSYLEVKADIKQASAGTTYTSGSVSANLVINATGGEGMSSHTSVSIPAKTGNVLSVSTGLLSLAANPAYTTQSVNPNTTNVKIGSFVLQNQTSSESIRVTNLAVAIHLVSGDATSTNYSNLKTSETSGNGSNPINLATAASGATSTNNFSVDFTLAPGATKVLDIFTDVSSATGVLHTNLIPTARGISSNVDATPGNQDGQTINVAAGTFGNAGIVISSTTAPQYVAAAGVGATDATVATYNFKASSGSATISELKFNVTTTGSRLSVSSVRVGTITAPVVSGVAYLTGLNLSVPSGGSGLNVPVYFTYGPVGTNGNTSGDASYVEMTYIKYTVGGTTSTLVGGQTTAVGNTVLGTITTLTAAAVDKTTTAVMTMADAATAAKFQPGMVVAIDDNAAGAATSIVEVQSVSGAAVTVLTLYGAGSRDGQVAYFYSIPQTAVYASSADNGIAMSMAGLSVLVGSTSGTDAMVIVGSKPTLTVVGAGTLLTNGLMKVGSVTVAADTRGDIAINDLPLAFTSTGNVASTLASVVVKNAADQSTITTSTGTVTALTAGATTGAATVTFTGGYTITAGQSVTFDIYVTTTGVTGGPNANYLSMKLGTNTGLTWTDVAGSATGTSTGALIYNYPTNSAVIHD